MQQWSGVVLAYGVVAGLTTVLALAFGWWRRMERTTRATREAQAKRVYASYLLQAMQHPELARPGPLDSAKIRQRAQYQWFVGYLLTVCEEILLIDPSPAWRDTLARQLAPHRAFLTSQAFLEGPYRGLIPGVRDVIAAVTSAEAVAPAGVEATASRAKR